MLFKKKKPFKYFLDETKTNLLLGIHPQIMMKH